MRKFNVIIFFITVILSFVSCTGGDDVSDIWSSAKYTADTSLGNGGTSITLDVTAQEKTVSLNINTDKEILGDALLELKLISGEKGPYGLYVKEVNGMIADYDINKSYWSLSENGEYMQTGVDSTKISDGGHYEFTYMK